MKWEIIWPQQDCQLLILNLFQVGIPTRVQSYLIIQLDAGATITAGSLELAITMRLEIRQVKWEFLWRLLILILYLQIQMAMVG